MLCGVVMTVGLGCGKARSQLPLVPVTGTVTLDNKPLTSTSLRFVPVGTTKGNGATGYTDEEGKYELRTPQGDLGAPAGEYRVIFSKLVMPDGSPFSGESEGGQMDSPAREILPPKFSDETQSNVRATVQPDGGEVNLVLSSKS
jgi:hypothetical protein